MELRQLSYFVAVAEAGSLRKAGHELRVHPSALSRSLALLERNIGIELFKRTPDGILLSAAGIEFLSHARSIVRSAEMAARAMRTFKERPPLRVGLIAGPLAAGELTGPILRRARTELAGQSVEPRTLSEFADQFHAVTQGLVDVAVVRGPVRHPDITLVPLVREPRALLVSRRSELADQERLTVDELKHLPTVRLHAPPGWAAFWQLDLDRGNPTPTHPRVARNLHEMRQAVASGQTFAGTSPAVGRLASDPDTRCVALDIEPSVIALAFRRNHEHAGIPAFVDAALATVDEDAHLMPGATPAS